MTLKGKTLFITGASRGIGLAIALRAARDGANIAIAAKTAEPHPKLPGTIYTRRRGDRGGRRQGAAAAWSTSATRTQVARGGRRRRSRRSAASTSCVNNASAISLTGTLETPMKRYDLMHRRQHARHLRCARRPASRTCKKAAQPAHPQHSRRRSTWSRKWFAPHVAYTMAKYGMSMCVLGMAEEFTRRRHRRQRAVAAHRHRHRRRCR